MELCNYLVPLNDVPMHDKKEPKSMVDDVMVK